MFTTCWPQTGAWQLQGPGSVFIWLLAHVNCHTDCCKKGLTAEHAHGRPPTFWLCKKKAPMRAGARASHWQVHEKLMGLKFFFLQMLSEHRNCSANSECVTEVGQHHAPRSLCSQGSWRWTVLRNQTPLQSLPALRSVKYRQFNFLYET